MKTKLKKLGAVIITLAMLLGMMPMTALASNYPTIVLDETITVDLNEDNEYQVLFEFIPEESGYYTFSSSNSNCDPIGVLLDENREEINRNDDFADREFRLKNYLEAGNQYYFRVERYGNTVENTIELIVTKSVVPTSVEFVQGESVTIMQGAYAYFDYNVVPENADLSTIVLDSSNYEVCTILYNGNYVALGVGIGTATITAFVSEEVSATIEINVIPAITAEADTEYTTDPSLYEYTTFSFTPEVNGFYCFEAYDATDMLETHIYDSGFNPIQYDTTEHNNETHSSKKAMLTAGETYYYATNYESSQVKTPYSVKISLVEEISDISFLFDEYTGTVGQTFQLVFNFDTNNDYNYCNDFSSSNSDVAEVESSSGMVTLKSIGEAVITAKVLGEEVTCKITVNDTPTITRCERKTETFLFPNLTTVYKFVPESDGLYAFYSITQHDTEGFLFDAETGDNLAYNDDYTSPQFRIEYTLTAGKEYLLKAKFFSDNISEDMTVAVSLLDDNGDIIHLPDENGVCGCGYFEHEHSGSAFNYDNLNHWGTCELCGEYIEEIHSFDEDGFCICGYFIHEHSLSNYSYSEQFHHGYCSVCDLYIEEPHVFDEEGNCICGYFIHEHDYVCVNFDDYYHDIMCTVCNCYLWEEHSYDEDGVCICGFFAHTHNSDGIDYDHQYHWSCCTVCGLEHGSLYGEHTYENGACTVCGRDQVTGVYFADTLLESGCYIDSYGNVTSECPEEGEGYAYLEDGVLTLCDFSFDGFSTISGHDACLYTDIDLIINLEGVNSIVSSSGDAIYAIGNITIQGDGVLYVDAYDSYDAIDSAEGGITVNSGTFHIIATDHAFESYGDLVINDGEFYIYAEDSAFYSNSSATFNGGLFLLTTDDNGIDISDNCTFTGGAFIIDAGDDGIDVGEALTFEGGSFNITSEDQGIDCGSNMTFNAGSYYILSGENGIEALSGDVTFNGGFFDICSEFNPIITNYKVTINDGSFRLLSNDPTYSVVSSYETIAISSEYGELEFIVDEFGYNIFLKDGALCSELSLDKLGTTKSMLERDWICSYYNCIDYTGFIIPEGVILFENENGALVYGEDYEVVWTNDCIYDPGTYIGVVKGIGDYCGELPIYITICNHSPADDGICYDCGGSDFITLTVDGVDHICAANGLAFIHAPAFKLDGTLGKLFKQWTIGDETDTFIVFNETDIGNAVYTSDKNAVVTAEYTTVGDIVEDERVNARDKSELTQIIKEPELGSSIADVNRDGKINARDKAALTEIIKGTYDYMPYLGQ